MLDRRPGLQQEFGSFIVEREIEEAYRLRDADIPPGTRFRDVAGPHAAGTYDRLREVFARVDFSNVQKAVMVGCGWRPVTTLYMHDETQVPEVVGLDIVEDAVDCARILGRKFGCDRLRVELADAMTYDYSDAQVIYVASMVTPKADVVARIADTAPPEAQIVLWEPVSLARLWMQTAMHPLDPRLEVIDTGSVNWLTTEVFVRFRWAKR
ncbi:MAG: class I SAM-dependent methyltransferase [Rhizobiaceae bacterium]|nr:MAG: class I SAM-dependent methyltransferase [Rhizobiaceae bacterium]